MRGLRIGSGQADAFGGFLIRVDLAGSADAFSPSSL